MREKLIIFLSLIILSSCSNSDNGDKPTPENSDAFNRKEMLTHWANNIIIPAYTDLYEANDKLNHDIKVFVENPNQKNLESARSAFRKAYITWQKVAFFEVGPAKNENLRQYFNIYPTNVSGIKESSKQNDYQLHLISNSSKQGYPAIDYLLNGIGNTDIEIINTYTVDANAENYKKYMVAVSYRLKEKTETVKNAWDTYKNTFISNDGSSSTSSVDLIANDYLLYYEKFYRNGKVRLPAGYNTGIGLPQNVEAYYSPDLSKTLFNTATKAMQDFFKGQNYYDNQSGLGFESYLKALNKENVSADINNGFNKILETSNALNGTLKDVAKNDRESLLNLQDRIQENVIPLKVDMLQALNISVAYVDGDGD